MNIRGSNTGGIRTVLDAVFLSSDYFLDNAFK